MKKVEDHPVDAPLALSSPSRGLRLVEDIVIVIENLRELAAFGAADAATVARIESDLRATVQACFPDRVH